MKEIIKPYKNDFTYSYASGAYATIELLEARSDAVTTVYLHSAYRDDSTIRLLCSKAGVPVKQSDQVFQRINQKENSYVLGVFDKYKSTISPLRPHVVLVNPGDMGNLGTIIRTIAGLNLCDLAIITPSADLWNPKTVRASMGALFRIGFEEFASFDEYRAKFPCHQMYPFMLDGELELEPLNCPKSKQFTLVFGNEAKGLGAEFQSIGTSVKIKQTGLVDSLNISIAVGIGAFIFAAGNDLL